MDILQKFLEFRLVKELFLHEDISGNRRRFPQIGTFLQFKKHEKRLWRSVTFSANACDFTESNTAPWVFLFLPNCAKHHRFFSCETDFLTMNFITVSLCMHSMCYSP